MNQESVVYGCIQDMALANNPEQLHSQRQHNRQVLMSLPGLEEWPLLSREMFSLPVAPLSLDQVQTDVMHFGCSYNAVEYEWQQWIDRFEALLKNMYWVSAMVHLETEFNGRHTFSWEAEDSFHQPDSGELALRCEWSREAMGF